MASLALTIPRGNFVHHSKQLQRRLQSTKNIPASPSPFLQGLFKPPSSIIKPWKVVAGAQEWQTSTYHYNKATTKNMPVAAVTTDKLLQAYSTMIKARGTGSSGASSTARNAIAGRRKSVEKMYISGSTVKDYGDRLVVNAFMFDGAEAAKEEQERKDKARKAAMQGAQGEKQDGQQRRRRGGGAGGPPGGRRRPVFRHAGPASTTGQSPPVRAPIRTIGGAPGAARSNRSPETQRALGARR